MKEAVVVIGAFCAIVITGVAFVLLSEKFNRWRRHRESAQQWEHEAIVEDRRIRSLPPEACLDCRTDPSGRCHRVEHGSWYPQ